MIGMIKEKFSEIATKCTTRYAKEEATMREKIQLVFKLSESGSEAEYLIYKDYKPLKKITFIQVLGVKIDMMGYSLYVPKFIRGSLVRFCETFDIEKKDIRVVLSIQENEDVFMYLYNGGKFIREVELESLFNPEDVVIEE
jgi:hypothetical protein